MNVVKVWSGAENGGGGCQIYRRAASVESAFAFSSGRRNTAVLQSFGAKCIHHVTVTLLGAIRLEVIATLSRVEAIAVQKKELVQWSAWSEGR